MQRLRLNDTRVSDSGVDALTDLSALKRLSIINTGITQAGYKRLRSQLPNCEIEWTERPADDVW
jgi:hypothetical protein